MKSVIMALCMALSLGANGISVYATESWPPSVSSPDFPPGCAELLLARPALFEGGGVMIRQGEAWLALGVGTAPLVLESGRKQSEDAAWKVANAKAMAALAEALWGVRMSAHESAEWQSQDSESGLRAVERFKSMSAEERGGVLAGSWEVGRWRLRGGAEVGVLRVVASPGHPIGQTAGRIPALSDTLDPAWREAILMRPALKYGGVSAAPCQGKTWLLVAGTARIKKGAAVVPPEAVLVAEAKARAEWLRFAQGARIKDRAQAGLEIQRIQAQHTPAWEDIRETLFTSTEAQIQGWSRGMIPAGMWLSDAGDGLCLAVVFRLSLTSDSLERSDFLNTPPLIPSYRK